MSEKIKTEKICGSSNNYYLSRYSKHSFSGNYSNLNENKESFSVIFKNELEKQQEEKKLGYTKESKQNKY